MYDYIIITHIPAFYKVNLYNEMAKNLNILVLFIASNTNEKRSDDFITLNNAKFKYEVLFSGDFQVRNVYHNIRKLQRILKKVSFKKILVSGWELKEFWYIILTTPKKRNCLALESTINESRIDSIRGLIKKIFLSRISKVFASGNLHKELLYALNYKGEIKITKGVGIINKPHFIKITKEYKKRFLFIGRLSNEKNIKSLIKIFNSMPTCTLTIIGVGPISKELKKISNKNINFIGKVENNKIKKYFFENDIFILPSISEPWGLVIEEALYFGVPVIVSKNCGASELITNNLNGFILDPKEMKSIINTILEINIINYKSLLLNVNKFSIEKKDINQVKVYS